ncbi:putative retrotransposon protein, partial [Tanacetum coccineum]
MFVEADEEFIEILFSFLTLPLGTIAKLLAKHADAKLWAKMGSVPLNSCEPARPADTNAAPVAHLRCYIEQDSHSVEHIETQYSKYQKLSRQFAAFQQLSSIIILDPFRNLS